MRVSAAILLVFACVFAVEAKMYCAAPHANDDGFDVHEGSFGICAAFIDYNNTYLEDGWDRMHFTVNPYYDWEVQLAGLGYLEGYLIHTRLWNHLQNSLDWFLFDYFKAKTVPKEALDYIDNNIAWLRKQIAANDLEMANSAGPMDENQQYWINVKMILTQVDAMLTGYNAAAPADQQLDETMWFMYHSLGDLLDIANIVKKETRFDWNNATYEEMTDRFILDSHCSGLVRLTDDYSELFFSQVAWFFYGSMTRVLKSYDLSGLHGEHADAMTTKKYTFSSYPGFLNSFDDMYVLDSGLAVLETTNEVFDTTLYDLAKPESILVWMRVVLTNRIATSGEAWVNTFKKFNSGTYNNQWLIADYKFLTPGKKPASNLLWYLEQIPGQTAEGDITEHLVNQHYMPSYNIPYNKHIFEVSGYTAMVKKVGDIWDYEECPRADIFRRDAKHVEHLGHMGRLMRSNDWMHDPLSEGNAGFAIASRYDMRVQNPLPFGAMDAKVTSYDLAMNQGLKMVAQLSPTYQSLTPWDFSTSSLWCPRRGLPDGPWRNPWVTYPSQVLKSYDLSGLHGEHADAMTTKKYTFSSYPGFLNSFDDMYVLDSGLAVLETTNEVFDTTLYDLAKPESILVWMRVVLTNRIATSGEAWVNTFKKFNSGTYNNQWLIADYKFLTPGKKPASNLLWYLEQIPGQTAEGDITEHLVNQHYMPSYNIPYNKHIFEVSGYTAMVKKVGDIWDYEECPRADIFRRDAKHVEHL
ncbi:Phospholipase B-like [Carpediemonas membranifera]|uniref:Phospholipase B-like n=1 Tax=Carpediemonas membranifera TaxID=201153 RepID=A0A8J6EBC3_9EUKA|nr:Phospholipase B-like [Carpediemonas membranifera]|eukprot:KAG9396820.1 Phospholipase B-like [Carpediemonas membranifera]